jgi:isopentenyldiphosphate isomerase
MAKQEERVDILVPPLFRPNGEVKTREQAQDDGDWIGAFNLWIFTRNPEPSIIYQRRSMLKKWAPGLLDVAAGGHYLAGEKLIDGLREVDEELGKHYTVNQLHYLGRSLFVGIDVKKRRLNEVIELYMTEDNDALSSYTLQEDEVDAIFACPIRELLRLRVNRDAEYSFRVTGLDKTGKAIDLDVRKSSFPENWNDYHYKMAILASRYFRGETSLLF